MNPSEVAMSPRATLTSTDASNGNKADYEDANDGDSLKSISICGQPLGTDLSDRDALHFFRGEPISAKLNFAPIATHARLHSRDRALKALVASFHAQMHKRDKQLQKRISQLSKEHERDLANVILAYDARSELLEKRCKRLQANEERMRMNLRSYQKKSETQREAMAQMRLKISTLKRQRSHGTAHSPSSASPQTIGVAVGSSGSSTANGCPHSIQKSKVLSSQ